MRKENHICLLKNTGMLKAYVSEFRFENYLTVKATIGDITTCSACMRE